MGKINVLDSFTANKIAAGEVVERPASVVKELVENSLDAGATKIDVVITKGGLDNITVTDNGEGMNGDDAVLSFHRHATSKIRTGADLDHISTLGFRGEALPSIAAVSRVELKTRRHDAIIGTQVILEDGQVIKEQETGCPVGTSISVQNLFANVPARLKSTKSVALEAAHISDVVSKLAISNPNVSFSLQHDNRSQLRTTGNGDLKSIIASVYGTEIGRNLIEITGIAGDIKVGGYVAKPIITRASRTHQIYLVNNRVVRSRVISFALEEAYHSLIMTGRHPIAFLTVEMPYNYVDPNVHPAKMEVRIYEADTLTQLIRDSVKRALTQRNLIPEGQTNYKGSREKTKPVEQMAVQYKLEIPSSKAVQPGIVMERPDKGLSRTGADVNQKLSLVDTPKIDTPMIETPVMESATDRLPALRPFGQVDCTYILAQGDEGLYIIDQHAAHERILYEKNMAGSEITCIQMLVIPENVELSHLETQILIDNILEFQQLGFLVEHFGGNTFLLRGVPKGFNPGTEKKIFLDLLDYFYQKRNKLTIKELHEDMLTMMSCKAAIKAGDRLTAGEMERLLDDLSKTELPFSCPHGRPTIVHITGYELEKMFKRVL